MIPASSQQTPEIYGTTRKHRIQMQNQIMMRAMSDPRFLLFNGNSIGLELKAEDLTNQPTPYVEGHFTLFGEVKKEADNCCMIVTVIFAALLYLPALIMCFDWWKKKVYAVYAIPLKTYQDLRSIIQRQEMKIFTLIVTDSTFDEEKAKVLYEIVSQSGLKMFTFINCAPNVDFQGTEYSNFQVNMKPIKSLSIQTNLSWLDKKVE